MKRLSEYFTRNSHGWVAILATTIFLLFMALVLPHQAAEPPELADLSHSVDEIVPDPVDILRHRHFSL